MRRCGRNAEHDGRKTIRCSVSDVFVGRNRVGNNEAVQENFELAVTALPAFLPLIKTMNLSHRNVTDTCQETVGAALEICKRV